MCLLTVALGGCVLTSCGGDDDDTSANTGNYGVFGTWNAICMESVGTDFDSNFNLKLNENGTYSSTHSLLGSGTWTNYSDADDLLDYYSGITRSDVARIIEFNAGYIGVLYYQDGDKNDLQLAIYDVNWKSMYTGFKALYILR